MPDGEGGNKWQRTGINDGLPTRIARAAEADPVSSPEGWGRFLSDQWLRFSFLKRTNESSCYGPHAIAIQSDRRSAINLRWIFLMPYYRVLSRLPARERASAGRSLLALLSRA